MPETLDVDAMITEIRAEIERLQGEISTLERVREIAQNRGYYGQQERLGRRDELRIFLRDHGPMKTADIAKLSGIPRGTVDYLLSDRENFRKLGDGTWAIRRKFLTAYVSEGIPNLAPADIASTSPETKTARRKECPLCGKQFGSGCRGWDAHIGSVSSCPRFHPEIKDSDERKRLFRAEHPDWFV